MVNQAVWGNYSGDSSGGTQCGAEVMAVSPPAVVGANSSTALLRVTTVFSSNTTSPNTTYVAVKTDVNGTALIAVEHLGPVTPPGGAGSVPLAVRQRGWARC